MHLGRNIQGEGTWPVSQVTGRHGNKSDLVVPLQLPLARCCCRWESGVHVQGEKRTPGWALATTPVLIACRNDEMWDRHSEITPPPAVLRVHILWPCVWDHPRQITSCRLLRRLSPDMSGWSRRHDIHSPLQQDSNALLLLSLQQSWAAGDRRACSQRR